MSLDYINPKNRKLGDNFFQILGEFIQEKPRSYKEIVDYIRELEENKSEILPERFFEVIHWKRNKTNSGLITHIVLFNELRGKIKQTDCGYELTNYGKELLENILNK